MPSSRRSSRSTYTSRQIPWRTPPPSKNSAPASVSLVFAEPEQGAPLASASRVIASTQLETSSIYSNDNASSSSQSVVHRASFSSMRTARLPAQEVVETHEDTPQPEPVVLESESVDPVQTQGIDAGPRPSSAPADGTVHGALPLTSANSNISSTSLPIPSTSARPSSKKPWFRSLTRPKGSKSPTPSKMNVVQSFQEPQFHDDSISPSALNAYDSPKHPSAVITRGNSAGATLEQPSFTPSSSSGYVAPLKQPISVSSTLPLHAPTPPTSHSPADATPTPSHTSSLPPSSITSPESRPGSPPVTQDPLPSSVGEEVPVVDLSAVLPPLPISMSTNTGIKLGTLSAPSSRFTLGMPFLGRNKVLLKTEGKDSEMGGLPSTQSAEAKTDLSLPQHITIENAAQDSLQNAIIHPSEPPSILTTEMETSKDKDIVPPLQQMSAAAAAEQPNVQVPHTQPPDSWWSYLGWSSSSAPPNPATSASPHESASMPSPPSDLRQSDSPSETQTTNSKPPLLFVPPRPIESTNPHTSPIKDSTPSKTSAASPSASGHANESRDGTITKSVDAFNSNGNDGFKASERDTLPRSLDSQERNSDGIQQQQQQPQQQQQQLESAEQSGTAVSSSDAPPPLASWFSPWSWYLNTSDQGNVDLSDARNNEEGRMEHAGSCDPERVAREEGEYGLHDDMGADTDGRKRTGMASDSKNQNMGEGVGEGRVREEIAHNGPDTDAELAIASESVSNPVEQSITTHRSGWASLFSSRRLVVKALEYKPTLSAGTGEVKRDENGMEVMDVDFDEDAASAEGKQYKDQGQIHSSDSGTDGRSMNEILKGGRTAKTSLGEGSKSSQLTLPVAPPLTTSEDIRKETVQSVPPMNPKKGIATSSKLISGSATPIPRSLTPTGKVSSTSSSPSAATFPVGGPRDRNHRTASPTPSSKKVPPSPNMVLPTWEDTFHMPPRSVLPPPAATAPDGSSTGASAKLLERAMGFVSGVLFSKDGKSPGMDNAKGKQGDRADGEGHNVGNLSAAEKERQKIFQHFGKELPRAWEIIERGATHPVTSGTVDVSPAPTSVIISNKSGHSSTVDKDGYKDGILGPNEQKHVHDVLRGCKRVIVIGVHGWFPGAVVRTVLGEPTGTSEKFVNMMTQALENFQREHDVSLEKITGIPLEGEGTIERRVEILYNKLCGNQAWIDDIHAADAIFVATHSQGSVVSTHLLDRLIRDRHINTSKSAQVLSSVPDASGNIVIPSTKLQRVCCLALCGIHLGPLRYLSSSTFVQPYLQYFESSAARELFEFQDTESAVSKSYVNALRYILDNGVKIVYVASLNDQVVPIYSGLFTAFSHPLILRALYIDGDAYHSSDFLSNLLVLLIRILNAGICDSGLLAHLSEATAGSLRGVGHSTAYEEIATYTLAVKYLFSTNDGLADHPTATLESFNANHEQNDYEIPWALRDVIADECVKHYFATEIAGLRDAFQDWHPKTSILRDLKRKLQPIQRLPATFSSQNSIYKL